MKRGSTSQKIRIFVQDITKAAGGLTGLVYNSPGLSASYCRDGDTSTTSISLVNATLGTFTSGGFKEVGDGWYELGVPDAALTTGNFVTIILKGASNMADCPVRIELTAFDAQDSLALGASRIDENVSAAKTLTAAYDAAKTAAAVGAKMDLINAPNAVALSAIAAALWNTLTSGMEVAGSIGKRLVDFFNAYTDGRAAKLDLLGAMTGSASPSTPALNSDITATANNHYAATFTISGMDSTGWTEMVFAIKADADADDDSEALLVVKVSNPGDEGDGLQVINRRPAGSASDATLAVSGVSPDTVLSLTITADGMAMPPSPSNKPYVWELVKWTGATKEKIGGAKFKVARPVVRARAAL